MKRITYLAAAGALVATPALGAWAAPTRPADDTPAAHVRVHARHGATTTRPRTAARHGADDHGGHHRHSGEPEPGDHGGTATSPATTTAARASSSPVTTTAARRRDRAR